MVIYLDIVIIENFIVDFFLLYITCQTLRIKINIKYNTFAAAIGALYVILMLYPIGKYVTSIPLKIMISFFMVFLVIRKKNVLLIVKAGMIFNLYAMLLAGVCIFISLSMNEYSYIDNMIINFSYKKLILSIMIIYITISRIVIFIKDRREVEKLIYSIDITFNNLQKRVEAFLDTGNELRDPATNLPVIVVEKDILEEIVIPEDKKMIISYKVVNGQYGEMYGFIPDEIKIHYDKKNIESIKAVVVFCDNKLSDLGEYNALLSRGIIY